MLSAQIKEHDSNVASATQEPTTIKVPSSEFRSEGPKGSAARKWIVLLVIVAVVGAAVWKIRKNAKEQDSVQLIMAAQAERPTPVQVSAVQQKTMPIFLTALGTVTAYNTVTIKSRVDGQLMQVPVREGQAVRQGQVLAEIDPKPYQAALEQAQGQLVKDQANAVNARAEMARYNALQQAGVVSKESQQLQASNAGQAEGSIAADQAAIQAAKVNLGYTKICVADQWSGGAAAGRSGQYCSCDGCDGIAGGDAVAADLGDLYATGGSVARGAEADAWRS